MRKIHHELPFFFFFAPDDLELTVTLTSDAPVSTSPVLALQTSANIPGLCDSGAQSQGSAHLGRQCISWATSASLPFVFSVFRSVLHVYLWLPTGLFITVSFFLHKGTARCLHQNHRLNHMKQGHRLSVMLLSERKLGFLFIHREWYLGGRWLQRALCPCSCLTRSAPLTGSMPLFSWSEGVIIHKELWCFYTLTRDLCHQVLDFTVLWLCEGPPHQKWSSGLGPPILQNCRSQLRLFIQKSSPPHTPVVSCDSRTSRPSQAVRSHSFSFFLF